MSRLHTRAIPPISLFILSLFATLVPAQTVNINFKDRGWYNVQGIHQPTNTNYLVGDNRIANCIPDQSCQDDFRNFFVFDLATVTQQIGSAKLAVYVPTQPGYTSADPSENYELHDVITPIQTLILGGGGTSAHADLGTGVVFGSRLMTAADMGKVVEIPLNAAAIAALNANHGLFALGGSITTLDQIPNFEVVFAASSDELTQLRLTLVPEPSAILLLSIGAIRLLGYRIARSIS